MNSIDQLEGQQVPPPDSVSYSPESRSFLHNASIYDKGFLDDKDKRVSLDEYLRS